TYSLICRIDSTNIPNAVVASYHHLCLGIIEGLEELGINAEFSSGSERACPNLFVKGRKISGNAQARSGRALLQHGTILRCIDLDLMFSFLKVDRTKADCLTLEHAASRLTSLEQELGNIPTFKQIESALLSGFTKVLVTNFVEGTLSSEETREIQHIAKTQYATSAWNFRR
ncbi:MAG: biotin/lipoate A/B protein ligase family protein, partial [Promethearchaeota archaeon]